MKMKPYLLLFIVLFVNCAVLSQDHKMQASLAIGPNWSTIKGDFNIPREVGYRYFEYRKRKIGMNAEIRLQYNFGKVFSINTGLQWCQKKNETYSVVFNNNRIQGSTEILTLDFAHIPINARFSFGSKSQFFVQIGPYIGKVFSAQMGNQNISSMFSSLENGFQVGVGFTRDINEYFALLAQAEYTRGLNYIAYGLETGPFTNSLNSRFGIVYKFAKASE